MNQLLSLKNILYEILASGTRDADPESVSMTQTLGLQMSKTFHKNQAEIGGNTIVIQNQVVTKVIVAKVVEGLQLLDRLLWDKTLDEKEESEPIPQKAIDVSTQPASALAQFGTTELLTEIYRRALESGEHLGQFQKEITKGYIQYALDRHGGTYRKVSAALGTDYGVITRRLRDGAEVKP